MKKVKIWKTQASKMKYLKGLMSDVKKEARVYEIDQNHDVGDYIKHTKFGFGFIQKIINKSKVEIFFEDSEKVMMQNWIKS